MSDTLGKLIRMRLKALQIPSEYRFAQLVKMNTGYLSTILNGTAPLAEEHLARWAEVLQWPQGTVEYARFVDMVKAERAKRYKNVGATVSDMEEKIKELKQQVASESARADANAAVAEELRAKVKALGEQIVTLRDAVNKLTGGASS